MYGEKSQPGTQCCSWLTTVALDTFRVSTMIDERDDDHLTCATEKTLYRNEKTGNHWEASNVETGSEDHSVVEGLCWEGYKERQIDNEHLRWYLPHRKGK